MAMQNPLRPCRSDARGVLRRVRTDERGFSLLETVIAITVIFGALLTLSYAATIGFQYESLARQKQTATGIADQIMEQTRGLAWDRITAGHLSSDLTADPNLVTSCAGDAAGVYRLLSCTAQTGRPGSGERVVAGASSCASSSPDCVVPLVRHTGQITQNNIAYTWRTYDTNNCPTAHDRRLRRDHAVSRDRDRDVDRRSRCPEQDRAGPESVLVAHRVPEHIDAPLRRPVSAVLPGCLERGTGQHQRHGHRGRDDLREWRSLHVGRAVQRATGAAVPGRGQLQSVGGSSRGLPRSQRRRPETSRRRRPRTRIPGPARARGPR